MSILHHLSLSRKFLILGVIVLVMVGLPAGWYLKGVAADLGVIQGEREGTAPLVALQAVIRLTQVHRGVAAGMLNANEALAQRRPKARDAVTEAFEAATIGLKSNALPDVLMLKWTDSQRAWKSLEAALAKRSLNAEQSTVQHTELIASLRQINEDVMDASGISLDPEAGTYFLGQGAGVDAPALAEQLGLMRAFGAGFLSQGGLSPEGRVRLLGLRDRANELHAHLFRQINAAIVADANLKIELGARAAAVQAQIARTLTYADQNLIEAATLKKGGIDYFDEFTRTIDNLYEFNAEAMKNLSVALDLRARTLKHTRNLVIGMALLLLAAATLLSVAFVRSISRPLQDAVAATRAVAQGDLSRPISALGSNEIGQLMGGLADMKEQLAAVVGGVRESAHHVATASAQIAQGNQALASRTDAQASALEETAASMTALSVAVRHNADNARQANQLALGASKAALHGGAVVGQAVNTMKGINDSSRKIADIIGVIDGIAFQTNLLALNAAVEAARAGEQGRGFAVVASEVRRLAGHSTEAAREIKNLINASVARVEEGTALVDQAGTAMVEIVASIKRVTDLMGDISTASAEQSAGVAEVGQAVSQIDQTTQQNAAMVQESAAAAQSLNEQAWQLVEAVAVFKLGTSATPEPTSAAASVSIRDVDQAQLQLNTRRTARSVSAQDGNF